jgi:NAD(P)-dependent dehydrogenase (short-subunit alcohol dehydrogenase family)
LSNALNGNTDDDGRKRILVIGGTGVVGAPIVRQLDQAGWTVRVTSRNASQARAKLSPRVELVAGDASTARASGGTPGALRKDPSRTCGVGEPSWAASTPLRDHRPLDGSSRVGISRAIAHR